MRSWVISEKKGKNRVVALPRCRLKQTSASTTAMQISSIQHTIIYPLILSLALCQVQYVLLSGVSVQLSGHGLSAKSRRQISVI